MFHQQENPTTQQHIPNTQQNIAAQLDFAGLKHMVNLQAFLESRYGLNFTKSGRWLVGSRPHSDVRNKSFSTYSRTEIGTVQFDTIPTQSKTENIHDTIYQTINGASCVVFKKQGDLICLFCSFDLESKK